MRAIHLLLIFLLSSPLLAEPAPDTRIQTHAGIACLPAENNPDRAIELAREGYLTLALGENSEVLRQLREAGADAGLLGRRLFVMPGSSEAIPLADRTVDRLVLDGIPEAGLTPAAGAEILRVLAPERGQALLNGSIMRRPASEESDDWTHRLHGPNNNPVSEDREFTGAPILQYLAPPLHTTFMGALLTTRGIRIEAFDWVVKRPGRKSLTGKILGRHAYSGLILWLRSLPEGVEADMPIIAAVDGNVYIASGDGPSVHVIDAVTGEDRGTIKLADNLSQRVYWMALEQGRMTALLGPSRQTRAPSSRMTGGPNRSLRLAMGEGGTLLVAYDLEEGRLLWRHDENASIDYRALAVRDGVTYLYADEKRLAALAADGTMLWENTDATILAAMRRASRIKNFNVEALPSLVVGPQGHLLLSYREGSRQFVLSSETGELLWEPGVPRGLAATKPQWFFVGNRLHGDRIYDADTGEVISPNTRIGGGCGLVAYSPGLDAGLSNKIGQFKAPCGVGALPALGLIHFMANHCTCWPFMRGASAFASETARFQHARENPVHPLVHGSRESPAVRITPAWAEYRGGSRRQGSFGFLTSSSAEVLWKTETPAPFAHDQTHNRLDFGFSDLPTPPLAGDGFAWFASSDGAIRCVDLDTGSPAWTFWTGGPVMTSPVVHEGRLYAASFDGWAYCLDAAEGALLWKWRGAPMDRVIPVFGKLVSAWPVVAVQFHEGVLYGVAGHWSVNGAVVFALDAVTGQPRWTHWSDPNQSAVDSETGSSPVAAGSGYLAILDDRLFVPNFASPVPFVFDCATGKPIPPSAGMKQLVETRSNRLGHRTSAPGIDMIPMEGNRLLGGGVPLLNPPNMRKNHTARFILYSMDGDGGIAVSPFPQTLIPNSFPAPAHDGNEMLVAGGVGRMTSRSAYPTLGASLWRKRDLLDPESRPADLRGKARSEAVIEPNGGRRSKRPPDALDLARAAAAELDFSKAIWSRTDIDLNAVALGPNAACLVVGQQAGGVSHDEHGGYEAWKLIALSREDGSVIWSVELPLEPVFNGIAAADGKIVLSLRDGTLVAVDCGEEGR